MKRITKKELEVMIKNVFNALMDVNDQAKADHARGFPYLKEIDDDYILVKARTRYEIRERGNSRGVKYVYLDHISPYSTIGKVIAAYLSIVEKAP